MNILYYKGFLFNHKCRCLFTNSTEASALSIPLSITPSRTCSLTSKHPNADLSARAHMSLPSRILTTTIISTSTLTSPEEREKERKKFIPLRRKINTSTKKLKWASTTSTRLMVLHPLFRQRQRHSTKKSLSFLRTRNLHGTTLGSLLLRILPYYHQDGP